MTIMPLESPHTFRSLGVQIYSDAGTLDDARDFERLLDCADAAVYPLRFSHQYTLGNTSRPRKVKAIKQYGDVIASWLKPGFCTAIQLSSDSMDIHAEDEDGVASLGVQRAVARVPGDVVPGIPMHVGCIRSSECSELLAENFVLRAVDMFNVCRGKFGVIHEATSHTYMMIEVGIARINPMTEVNIEHTARRSERVGWSRREHIGDEASGAYWGMMLGRSMVERLGGLERIEREAPVASTQRLEHGAIMLRATEKPVPLTDPDLQSRLPALEQYIEPIAVPIGPYFREILRGDLEG